MKNIILLVILSAGYLQGQPTVSKTLPVQKGQKIRMNFDYPNLIRVSTWDKNEVLIEGIVSINGGEHNDAFKLNTSTEGNFIQVTNEINFKDIPHRYSITWGGQKIVFKDKGAWRKYQEENGGNYERSNEGVDMEILLEIKVPGNIETIVQSTYGMVEVKNFKGPLTVKSTYGGVDVSINESAVGELKAETNYGHIYSDLDLKFKQDGIREEAFHTVVAARLGTGPSVTFESPYGNVYLRKSK